MKKNIMRLLTFALIVMFSQSLVAQEEGRQRGGQRQSREERAKQQKEQLVKDLKLNKEQVKKVDVANKKFNEQWTKVRESGDRENMRGKMTKLTAKRDSIYKTIFTKEQVKLYDEILKKRAAARRGRGRGIR